MKQMISIVVPCYNEEEGLSGLKRQLIPVVKKLREDYAVELVLVDDGSRDKTPELLKREFGGHKWARILTHKENRNLGAALRTAFKAVKGDLVFALDSDCTYDPQIIFKMLKELDKDTDIVTASPYHPEGKVENVPGYRLLLSKGVTMLYRIALFRWIYTFTAMVRLYRKEVVKRFRIERNGFIGVTELMVKALLNGYRVKELPATLKVRKHGASRMRVVGTIISHLKFLARIASWRVKMLFGGSIE